MKTYEPVFIVEVGGRKLPEDISDQIENFSYEENEKKMDELSLSIISQDMRLVDSRFLQEGKEIRVRWGYVNNLSEVRTCTIKEIDYSFGEEGIVKIDVRGYDRRHRLTGRASRTCWSGKKTSEIVKDIAAKHNLKPAVEIPDDITHEFMSEGAKNDLTFLRELASDTGCSVWVVNNELHFKPNKIDEPVYRFRYREEQDGYLKSFRISSRAEQGKGTGLRTEVSGIDPLSKKEFRQSATQGEKKTERETVSVALGDVPLPEKRVGNETSLQPKADESGRVIATPVQNKAHATSIAAGKVRTSAIRSIQAEAVTIGLPYLKARESVTIENIGRKFSGNWRITRVRHDISRSGYTCSLSLSKNDHEGRGSRSSNAGKPPKTVQGNSRSAKDVNKAGAKKAKSGAQPFITVDLSR